MRAAIFAILVGVATAATATDYKIVRRTTIDDGQRQEQTEYWTSGRV